MRRSVLAVPLVVAALASGCGGEPSSAGDFEGEEKQVAELVEKLESAGESGDAQTICAEIVAKGLSEQIAAAGSSCEAEMEKAIEDAEDFSLDVEDVTIQGDSATARVKGRDRGADRVRTFEFERDGKSWRATNLGS